MRASKTTTVTASAARHAIDSYFLLFTFPRSCPTWNDLLDKYGGLNWCESMPPQRFPTVGNVDFMLWRRLNSNDFLRRLFKLYKTLIVCIKNMLCKHKTFHQKPRIILFLFIWFVKLFQRIFPWQKNQ